MRLAQLNALPGLDVDWLEEPWNSCRGAQNLLEQLHRISPVAACNLPHVPHNKLACIQVCCRHIETAAARMFPRDLGHEFGIHITLKLPFQGAVIVEAVGKDAGDPLVPEDFLVCLGGIKFLQQSVIFRPEKGNRRHERAG